MIITTSKRLSEIHKKKHFEITFWHCWDRTFPNTEINFLFLFVCSFYFQVLLHHLLCVSNPMGNIVTVCKYVKFNDSDCVIFYKSIILLIGSETTVYFSYDIVRLS